ncbi:hypothetical protein [Peribacillus butanolivorans]|uniref:Alpha/beta hydrolase n=1 Tax=Peribacillus butanolivorans TaxID=421767 RepID=A0ABN5MW28_9BACI|nr:hypothetical protein [Peribacillus butanolivorans]AXN37234.1 hypothetical protein DTO10_01675 [Peribacillus butanolivorans]
MVSMKDIGNKLSKATSKVADTTQKLLMGVGEDLEGLIDNTRECINSALDCGGNIYKEIDDFRNKNILRIIDHHIAINQLLLEIGTIPIELIREVYDRVQKELRKEIKPVIYKVINPKAAVWDGNVELEEISIPYTFPENRTPFIFIHGAFNKQNKDTAFDFYKPFEDEVKMFKDLPTEFKYIDIYIVSYDTELTDEYEWIIRKGFELSLGPITDPEPNPEPNMFAAVFWSELIKRAEEVGDALVPFLKGIAEQVNKEQIGRGTIISHSLGCHVFAHAAQSFIKESGGTSSIFSEWLCMAAALPMGSLEPGGKYSEANKAIDVDNPSVGVYHSYLDGILSTAYIAATGNLAIGQVGVLMKQSNIYNRNVTLEVNVIHTISDGYFAKLGEELYGHFHINPG